MSDLVGNPEDQFSHLSMTLSGLTAMNNLSLDVIDISLVVRKPVFWVSDLVPHKPGCTATEDGWTLEILYVGSKGIVPSV